MAIYTGSKPVMGQVSPENAIEEVWPSLAPLITVEDLKDRFLFGIPLVSQLRDPVTGKVKVMTSDMLAKYIRNAVMEVANETDSMVMPTQFSERHAYDEKAYHSYCYLRLRHRPVSSIEGFRVESSDGATQIDLPLAWVEIGNAVTGQLNVVPLTVATNSNNQVVSSTPGGAVWLSVLATRSWVPAFWTITYTTGYPNGMLPWNVNEMVGVVAAINVLSLLAPTRQVNSSSLGLDGMSQSVSGPGPQIYQQRIQELAEKRKMLKRKIKRNAGTLFVIGEV